jgi:hypothetical protein
MDPRRITEVFALHGDVATWESHLKVVESLQAWDPGELVDFQESLLDHLAAGLWVCTSVNQIVTLADGSQARVDLPFSLDDDIILAMEDEGVDLDFFTSLNAALRSGAPPEAPPEVPSGWIGIPVHPWAHAPNIPTADKADSVAFLRARRAWTELASNPREQDWAWILRAAPWALHRATGRRMGGILPRRDEERWAADGPPTAWGGRYVLTRGSDRVELFRLAMAVSADESSVHFIDYFSQLVRRLKAKVSEVEWVPVGGQFTPGAGWSDGQVVWAGSRTTELAETNALLESLLEITQTPKNLKPARLMADKAFWALIGILEGDAESNRWEDLVAALSLKQASAIRSFAETLAAKLYALDRPDLLEFDSTGLGLSADVHLYLRCAIVAAGPEAYAAALTHPVREELLESGAGEQLLSVASAAFEQRTGWPLDDQTAVSYETGSNAEAWGRSEPGEGSVVAWTVNSVEPRPEGPVDTIRYWRTRVRDHAIERHRRSGTGGVIVGAQAILRDEAMTHTVAIAGVLYSRPVPPEL